MKTAFSVLFSLSVVLSLSAQEATEPWPIKLQETKSGSLETESLHAYHVEIADGQFVLGVANQIDVDVTVTIYGPDDAVIRNFDNPARGPEVFQFETEASGKHRIEIKPFEEETGDYTLSIDRIEPIATNPEARVDQLMAVYDRDDVPGGVVGVMKDGKLAFAKAYGAADLSHDVAFTTETLTNIGSTSKQFTAFSIALLAEREKLSMDDDVRKHIPELPDFGKTVTLRHLMTHTSGYREFLNALALTGRQLGEGDYIDRDELIELVQRQPELQNDPGAEWNYNNTAFGLLTVVVERVTGESFPAWMKENVFHPLGMHHTMVRNSQSEIVPNRSVGYLTDDEGRFREAADLGGAMGAGGIYTTPGDLAKWMANFRDPKVGSPSIFGEMSMSYVLNDGDTTGYGLGLSIDELRGLKRVHHGGADIAHRSMLMYFPEINGGVVALSNFGAFNNPAQKVAEAFFGDQMMQEEPIEVMQNEETAGAVFDPAQYDPASFDDFVGRYELTPGFILNFTREDERLLTQATGQQQLEIYPTSDTTFMLKVVEASLTFHRDADGSVNAVTLHQNGDHKGERLTEEPWSPSDADLAAYKGRYFSEELETFYNISIEDGELTLTQRRLDDITLNPKEKDVFTGSFPIAEITFIRSEAGDVSGFTVSNVRTRGVSFERVE